MQGKIRALVRQIDIVVYGAFLILLLFLYFSPTVSTSTRSIFSNYSTFPLRAMLLSALAYGVGRVRSPSERRFWIVMTVAFATWFIADVAFQPEGARTLIWSLLEDIGFLLFYPILVVAIEQRPHQFYRPIARGGIRWLCAASGVVLVFWTYVYFVGLTAVLRPAIFISAVPSYLFYVASDLVIAALLMRHGLGAVGRWRAMYLLLAAGFLMWAFSDLLEGLIRLGSLKIPYGTPLDLLWHLPYFMVAAAAVTRNRTAASARREPAATTASLRSLVAATYSYAFAIPVIHLAVFASGWHRDLELPREVTVLVGLAVLLGMGWTAQRSERRRQAISATPRVVVLDEEEQQSQKMEALGRLAGGIAHDFNNLLLILQAQLDLGRALLAEDPKGRGLADEMQASIERGSELTRQLLAFGRKQMTSRRVVDIREVTTDALALVRRTLGEHIELGVTADADLWPVKVDPGQLVQVLVNLALNARAAMPRGGRLEIGMRNVVLEEGGVQLEPDTVGRFVEIAVRDTGIGMDEHTLQRIFEPFFTTRTDHRGIGLGLAVVYGIVKQSGGHVSCESVESEGATFRIHLPAAEGPVTDPPSVERAPAASPGGTETILFAEDDPDVRRLTVGSLESFGYRVLEAKDGVEALEVAAAYRGPIDLLVTDVVMPRMGGRELAERLTAQRPSTAVLFVSGYVQDDGGPQELTAQGNILLKPYSLAALEQKLRSVLDHPPAAEK